jgi:DNA-binding response OmpR family regulator
MQRAGYETRVARDGHAALACVTEFLPEVVLLDIMLPGCSGFEVCARIRADPALRATRVMMLTARSAADDDERGRAAGADDYLTKPFSTHELVGRVRALLEEARA